MVSYGRKIKRIWKQQVDLPTSTGVGAAVPKSMKPRASVSQLRMVLNCIVACALCMCVSV